MYWIGALPPGAYEVTFSRPGLSALSRPALVQLGRVARADAALEPSDDEESVTSTARTVSVGDTTAISTHFTAAQLDRMPVVRDPYGAAELAPGRASLARDAGVDDVPLLYPYFLGEEIASEVTVFRGGLGAEVDSASESLIAMRTRSGSEELTVSLRDTLSGGEHLLESASGGRIVPQRLWFFGAGWAGDSDYRFLRRARGVSGKLTAQAGSAHNVVVHHIDAQTRGVLGDINTSATSLRYTAAAGARTTIEAMAARSTWDYAPSIAEPVTIYAAKAAYVAGDHVLSGGVSQWNHDVDAADRSSLFVNDRWSAGRWVVQAGLRYDLEADDALAPRAGITYDLRGNGRHALVATYGEYAVSNSGSEVTSIGYVAALGQSGTARIDLQRRNDDDRARVDSVSIDARYRLFDRFEVGGNYHHARERSDFLSPLPFDDVANAWFGMQIPVGGHELSATVLQHYAAHASASHSPTDFALRYNFPIGRLGLTLAGDVTNAFSTDDPAIPRRTRVWARLTY